MVSLGGDGRVRKSSWQVVDALANRVTYAFRKHVHYELALALPVLYVGYALQNTQGVHPQIADGWGAAGGDGILNRLGTARRRESRGIDQ